jgi:hypothetical protein
MRNRAARLTKPDWEAFDQTPKLKLAGGLRCRSRPSGISWTALARLTIPTSRPFLDVMQISPEFSSAARRAPAPEFL